MTDFESSQALSDTGIEDRMIHVLLVIVIS
jgi:hypothetical protein